jgi:hypothetical protein
VAVFITEKKLMPANINDKFRKSYSLLTKSLNSGISNVDTTIPLNNVTNIPTDTAVDCIIDRVDANGTRTPTTREIVKGVVSGTSLINCVRGLHGTTAQSHLSGAVVEFTVSAVSNNDAVDGILAEHNQDGTHGAVTATSLAVSGTTNLTGAVTIPTGTVTSPKQSTEIQQGWESSYGGTTVPAPNTVTANGNRSYSCVFNSVDLTGALSAGMRLRTTRTVSAPTQCTSLNGTNQYYSKSSPAGMTFTDDFVVSAWVKLTQYGTPDMVIASRYNGTSGWRFMLQGSGQVYMSGVKGGSGNISRVSSYQSIPLNKWVHVTAQLDMSTFTATTTTSYVMIDGVDVPASVARAGTNPTDLTQAGNLEIGAENGGANPFPGKIAQVAIYNAKVTQATIKASISQGLSGSETSLISAYSFNNAITDLSANANNLTANGAAVATNADSPFGTQASGLISATLDYGIIQSVTFSTNTTVVVQVPEGCTIPTSGGVSAVSYSTQKAPYGFPAQRGKWGVLSMYKAAVSQTTPTSVTWYNVGSNKLTIPTGEWDVSYRVSVTANSTSITSNFQTNISASLSTSTSAESDVDFTCLGNYLGYVSANLYTVTLPVYSRKAISTTTDTPYYAIAKHSSSGSVTAIYFNNDSSPLLMLAEPSHL